MKTKNNFQNFFKVDKDECVMRNIIDAPTKCFSEIYVSAYFEVCESMYSSNKLQ